jgi:CRP-like cAMP-binding protein
MVHPLIAAIEKHGPLTEDEKAVLRDISDDVVTFAAKTDLVRPGDECAYSTLLLDGVAARYSTFADGQRQISALHVTGDFVDLHSFLLKKMDDGVMALSPCRAARVAHKDLLEISGRYPYLTRAFWLMTLIDGAISRHLTAAIGRRSARQRVAHILCEMHCRLGNMGLVRNGGFDFPATQEELGDMLGLSTVHVNRTLQELRSDGLIATSGRHIEIHDWDRLAEEAEFDATYLHSYQQLER